MFKMASAKRLKYGNRKVTKNGETWDSVREYERHLVLLDMQKRGEIRNLERQPRWPVEINRVKICTYIGDWQYQEPSGPLSTKRLPVWRTVVEDAKGFQTAEFKLKFRLMKALYPEIDWRLS
jgi:hypothetical protein